MTINNIRYIIQDILDDIINKDESDLINYDTNILLDLLVIGKRVSECEDKIREVIASRHGL